MPWRFNPFSGTLDFTESSNGSTAIIQELDSDPVSPSVNEAWVLRVKTVSELSHTLLHFGMTAPGDQLSWTFKYKTESGQVVGVPLT